MSMATTKAEAEAVMRQVLSKIATDDDFNTAVWRSNLKTHMAGQLFIREVEVQKTERKLTGQAPDTFLNLPFDEAIAHFLARGYMPADEFYALSDAERFRSFTMSQAASETILANAKTLLDSAMQPDGIGMQGFISAIQADEVALGFTPNSHAYLENVYRTSTATSYNAGRLRQQTDPDVIAAGGVWEYMTANDSRVRSSHAALHGAQFEVNDPKALRIYPPNAYQCRCVMLTLDDEDRNEGEFNRPIPDDVITTGFGGPPDETIQREAST